MGGLTLPLLHCFAQIRALQILFLVKKLEAEGISNGARLGQKSAVRKNREENHLQRPEQCSAAFSGRINYFADNTREKK